MIDKGLERIKKGKHVSSIWYEQASENERNKQTVIIVFAVTNRADGFQFLFS